MANLRPKQENLKNKGKGRPKGIPNKFTTLKDSFLHAFNKIGGEKELAAWAKEKKNRTAFYQMIAKMLPSKIDADVMLFPDTETFELPKLKIPASNDGNVIKGEGNDR